MLRDQLVGRAAAGDGMVRVPRTAGATTLP